MVFFARHRAGFFRDFHRARPDESRSGVSGLSDTMQPGTIANLIKSDAVVFRVQFEDRIPPYQTLYWRGPVLVNFDGSTWRRNEFDPFIEPRYERREAPTSYTVTLESTNGKNWLFALDVPGTLPYGARLRSDLQLLSLRWNGAQDATLQESRTWPEMWACRAAFVW